MSHLIKQTQSLLTSLTYCLRLSWQASPFYTAARLAAKLILALQSIAAAYVMKFILDLLTHPSQPDIYVRLLGYLAMMLGLYLIWAAMGKLTGYAQSMQNEILQKKLSVMMMDKALTADLSMFDNPSYYDKFDKVQNDSRSLSYITWSAIDCLSNLISFLSAFLILCTSNIWFGLLMTAAAIPSAIAGQKYTKAVYSLEKEQVNELRKKGYLSFLATSKHYAQDVRLFHLGPYLKDKFEAVWLSAYLKRRNLIRSRTVVTAFMELLPQVVMVGMIWFIAVQVIDGNATVGDYSLYTGLLSQISGAILMLVNSVMQVYDNQIKIQNVRSFEDIPKLVLDNGSKELKEVQTLSFEQVSFCYPQTENMVLQDVTFTARAGESLALVGVNGSGKTTMIKLLLRYYDPTGGRICINGTDIKEYRLDSLRNAFSCYFQNNPNFGFSLGENIAISDWEHPMEEKRVREVLHQSSAEDILGKAAAGLDTPLTRQFEENGMELSGGQQQKVAIARAFYRAKDASVLVMDEPSSSLDPQAEQRIFDALAEIGADKLVFFTTHRFSNIVIADRILLLENGRITEDGTREELMAKGGSFAALFGSQAKREEFYCVR